MQDLLKFFQTGDRFARHSDIELLEVKPGFAKARMEIREKHLNGLGTAQGGAVFTLADLAFAAACNSHESAAVALNVNITFIKAGMPGMVLTAEANEVSLGKGTGNYTVRVTDDNGDLVALFQGLAYRLKKPLPADHVVQR